MWDEANGGGTGEVDFICYGQESGSIGGMNIYATNTTYAPVLLASFLGSGSSINRDLDVSGNLTITNGTSSGTLSYNSNSDGNFDMSHGLDLNGNLDLSGNLTMENNNGLTGTLSIDNSGNFSMNTGFVSGTYNDAAANYISLSNPDTSGPTEIYLQNINNSGASIRTNGGLSINWVKLLYLLFMIQEVILHKVWLKLKKIAKK
jgi:hypothetical protein